MDKQIQPSEYSTLIILDWDDTLFPTHWVISNNMNVGNKLLRHKYIDYFKNLDGVLSKFLQKIIKIGKVIIITNALLEWIGLSSDILPKTTQVLKHIKVISARAKYQPVSENIMDWKELAFKNEIASEFKTTQPLNVISIGDANYEYKALISLFNWNQHKSEKILKSVKFIKDPHHHTLIEQLKILDSAIIDIVKLNKHLDLKFDPVQN